MIAEKINADNEIKALLSIIHFTSTILLIAAISYIAVLIVRKLKNSRNS